MGSDGGVVWEVGRDPTGGGRPAREGGGGPRRGWGGHGRSRVTYKGQETPRVPLHHASHGPPPPKGEDRQWQLPTPRQTIPPPNVSCSIASGPVRAAPPLGGAGNRPRKNGAGKGPQNSHSAGSLAPG